MLFPHLNLSVSEKVKDWPDHWSASSCCLSGSILFCPFRSEICPSNCQRRFAVFSAQSCSLVSGSLRLTCAIASIAFQFWGPVVLMYRVEESERLVCAISRAAFYFSRPDRSLHLGGRSERLPFPIPALPFRFLGSSFAGIFLQDQRDWLERDRQVRALNDLKVKCVSPPDNDVSIVSVLDIRALVVSSALCSSREVEHISTLVNDEIDA